MQGYSWAEISKSGILHEVLVGLAQSTHTVSQTPTAQGKKSTYMQQKLSGDATSIEIACEGLDDCGLVKQLINVTRLPLDQKSKVQLDLKECWLYKE